MFEKRLEKKKRLENFNNIREMVTPRSRKKTVYVLNKDL